ncbi:MAG: hypothetical protein Pg6A_13060 [Termitinemataceae bacterium]|nr:MAG: hypothetical protein Pg6A_13060 [Termitinemataceae bacterium]
MTAEEAAINQRIKKLRLYLGINQREFCKLLSLSVGYISTIEVNRRPSNERLIKLIVSEFGVNEEWLLTGKGEMLTNQEKDERTTRLVALFNDLSRDNQDVVFSMIDVLRKKEDEQKQRCCAAGD